jgi:hypothetical protein
MRDQVVRLTEPTSKSDRRIARGDGTVDKREMASEADAVAESAAAVGDAAAAG